MFYNRRVLISVTFTDFSGDELVAQLLEEEEAKAMQARLAEQLDEEDFDLDLFVVIHALINCRFNKIFVEW